MIFLILVLAFVAIVLFCIGALAAADPEGRGGHYLMTCWGLAVPLIFADVVFIIREVFA